MMELFVRVQRAGLGLRARALMVLWIQKRARMATVIMKVHVLATMMTFRVTGKVNIALNVKIIILQK
ncbi:MAG: hypothetical protein CL988_01410 [Euryarchaeota archaeon]|nr:hypothetical protein [Euryarchaeota archaeon]